MNIAFEEYDETSIINFSIIKFYGEYFVEFSIVYNNEDGCKKVKDIKCVVNNASNIKEALYLIAKKYNFSQRNVFSFNQN